MSLGHELDSSDDDPSPAYHIARARYFIQQADYSQAENSIREAIKRDVQVRTYVCTCTYMYICTYVLFRIIWTSFQHEGHTYLCTYETMLEDDTNIVIFCSCTCNTICITNSIYSTYSDYCKFTYTYVCTCLYKIYLFQLLLCYAGLIL